MKYAIVPAQIMTVEDRITGNLSLPQMVLLFVPVFAAILAYVGLPPAYEYAPYKVVLVLITALICGLSAIRLKGRILIAWAAVFLTYNLRPRYHIYDKNDLYLRDSSQKQMAWKAQVEEVQQEERPRPATPQLSVADLMQLESILTNPKANVRFTNEKGRLRVRATEIK